MKLSLSQKNVLDILKQYPNVIIMYDGYITGGHGIKLDMRVVNALKRNGLITSDNRLSKKYYETQENCNDKSKESSSL